MKTNPVQLKEKIVIFINLEDPPLKLGFFFFTVVVAEMYFRICATCSWITVVVTLTRTLSSCFHF